MELSKKQILDIIDQAIIYAYEKPVYISTDTANMILKKADIDLILTCEAYEDKIMTQDIYIHKETGEEFLCRPVNDGEMPNFVNCFVTLEPINKKFPWEDVASGVLVKISGGATILYDKAEHNDQYKLDTENWQCWGVFHQSYGFGNCPLPGCVDYEAQLLDGRYIEVGEMNREVFSSHWEKQIFAFRVKGLSKGWEY